MQKFSIHLPVCSTYELTKQFMDICVKNCAIDLKKNNLYLYRKKVLSAMLLHFLWYSQLCFAWKNAIKGYILLIDLYCSCIFSKSYFEIHKLFSLLSVIPNLKSYSINKGSLLACGLVLLKKKSTAQFSAT